jgi:hypothetical protein
MSSELTITRGGARGSWPIALGFLGCYVAIGFLWVSHTSVLTVFDVVFDADLQRVVLNMTSLDHTHGRVVVHPLHVLMTAPLGVPLAALLGSFEFAAVLLNALVAAAALYLFSALLHDCTKLGAFDRALFVIFAGISAGYFTFGSLPETHVLSALTLLWMARFLERTATTPVRRLPSGFRGWTRLFAELGLLRALWASGVLVTNLALAPCCAWLRLSRELSWKRRLLAVVVLTGALVVLLGTLHVAQRAVFFGHHAAAEAAEQARTEAAPTPPSADQAAQPGGAQGEGSRVDSALAWLKKRFDTELKYLTWSPRRTWDIVVAAFVTDFYAPRLFVGRNSADLKAVRLQGLDLRAAGIVGAVAWLVVVLAVAATAIQRRAFAAYREPAAAFIACWLALDLAILNVYYIYPVGSPGGNDVFLFSPELVFPVVFLVAIGWAQLVPRASVRAQRAARATLLIALVAAVVNTAQHVHDLLGQFWLSS